MAASNPPSYEMLPQENLHFFEIVLEYSQYDLLSLKGSST